MSKHYTFSDCIDYAYAHNIAFNFYYCDNDLHYLYCDISDGADGYLTATQAVFEFDNFSREYVATMNLNIRYAYSKDYEFMRRMELAINKRRHDTMKHCKSIWNYGMMHWYGAGAFTNSHINASYVRAESVHGNSVWSD